MKKIQKRGITIVTLVITIIILVLLTGAVMLTMNNTDIFGQTKNTVDEHNKQAIIEQIKLEIETEMIKKVNEIGRYQRLSKEETINIIEQYGTYEEDTLKLTTTEKNIPIYLYEILDIKVEEYVTAVYKDKQFTLTEKEESLSSNGYKYEYTFDNGIVWQTYTSPITIEEQSGIKVRLANSEGQVISNEYVVTKGVGEETVNNIKTITITKAPTKTTYIQGQTFNPSGMVVTVTYEDNTSKVVTNYNYTPTRALTVSDRYVTISYTENGVTKQTTQAITVTNKLTAIGITELKKTKYKQGETINKSDIVVTALYEDNSTKAVTDFTYEPTGELTAENTSITVTYTEDGVTKTTSKDIQVTYIATLEITSEPSVEFKTTYIKGEDFDPTGLIVSVIYEDTNALPITNYEIVNGENLQVGTTEIIIRYTEGGITLEKGIPITVTNDITSIAVTNPPTKTLYKDNDTFDKAGMEITATYQDTTTRVLEESEYTVSTPTYEQEYVTITHIETGLTTTQAVTIDNSKPTVTIASNKASPTNASEIIYTITFSEDVIDFTKEDLTLTNIETSTLSGSGKEYTLTVTTIANQNNTQSVSLAEGKCIDSVGNTNEASNTVQIAVDRVAPTCIITTTASNPTNASSVTYTITFSEDVTGFEIGDISVENGTGTLTGSGKIYTLAVPTSANQYNTQSVSVAAEKCIDSAGNGNAVSNTTQVTIDRVAPNDFTPTVSARTANSITISASTTDNSGQTVTYMYSSDNGSTWKTANPITGLSAGIKYNIKVKAIDKAGNEKVSSTTIQTSVLTTLAAHTKASYYGDSVDYSAGGITSWGLFYNKNNQRVFIISNTNIGNRTLPYSNFYNISTTITDLFMLTNPGVSYTTGYTLNSSYRNSKEVSWLMYTNNWTTYVNSSFADYAIGSPTLPMFVASWNAKVKSPIIDCSMVYADGFGIDTSTGAGTPVGEPYWVGFSKNTFYASFNYWLSSPSTDYENSYKCVKTIWTSGVGHDWGENTEFGLRPVVALNTSVKAYWNGSTWILQ